jgi:segregation and condensation protein B
VEKYMTDSVPREEIEEEISDEQFNGPEDIDAEAVNSALKETVELTDDIEPTVEAVVEAILFASDEPLSAERLVHIVEAGGVRQIRKCIESLNEKYEVGNFTFRIEQIAGGYQMMTLSQYNHWLKRLLRARTDTKLSQAALETLAIIAYKQPVMRADIEAIRGVAAGEVIRGLIYKGLVKIVGRAEVLGRPMLYGTTKKFLEIFGLNTLKDLPKIEELKKPEQ